MKILLNRHKRTAVLAAGLVFLSGILYFTHYLIFHDAHHIMIYLLGDIAFVPLEVLLVSLVLHQVLTQHEKRTRASKMRMVVGTYFHEMGQHLIREVSAFTVYPQALKDALVFDVNTSGDQFSKTAALVRATALKPKPAPEQLQALKEYLLGKRSLLLQLLENQNLQEHEQMADLLLALSHCADELQHRDTFDDSSERDKAHLCIDIARFHLLNLLLWVEYMQHLQKTYPFLYSLALRTNPFDSNAHVKIA